MLSAYIEKADRAIAFQIVHQDDEITNKINREGYFTASNGWTVRIDIAPEIDVLNQAIYLRGSDKSKDSRISRVWDLSSNSNRDSYVKQIDTAIKELVNWANSPLTTFNYRIATTEYSEPRRPTPRSNPKITNKPIVHK